MRICKDCNNPLTEDEYKPRYGNWCITCRRKYHKVRTAKHRQSLRDKGVILNPIEISRRRNLKDNFGLSLEDYNRLAEAQSFKCKICDRPERIGTKALAVDHNHTTGQIRGLLCHHCNIGLGHFEDNQELLMKAVSYLRDAVKK